MVKTNSAIINREYWQLFFFLTSKLIFIFFKLVLCKCFSVVLGRYISFYQCQAALTELAQVCQLAQSTSHPVQSLQSQHRKVGKNIEGVERTLPNSNWLDNKFRIQNIFLHVHALSPSLSLLQSHLFHSFPQSPKTSRCKYIPSPQKYRSNSLLHPHRIYL